MFGTKSLKEIRAAVARRAELEGIDPTELFTDLVASHKRDADLLRSVRHDLSQAVRELKTKRPKKRPQARAKRTV